MNSYCIYRLLTTYYQLARSVYVDTYIESLEYICMYICTRPEMQHKCDTITETGCSEQDKGYMHAEYISSMHT